MQIHLSLSLPRDELTIPVARHICRHALADLGVDPACSADIELALTEACANVLKHSGGEDEYEVSLSVEPDVCVIRVIDTGHGFDSRALAQPEAMGESGRGIGLMAALVDQVTFESQPEEGTVVHLEKRLALSDESAMARLAAVGD